MRGTGFMYVKKDSKILYFCSRKCEKNMLVLGRKPRTTTWTTQARDDKKARLLAASHAPTKSAKKKVKKKPVAAPLKTAAKKAPAKAAAKKSVKQ